jgi:hypothetical protein
MNEYYHLTKEQGDAISRQGLIDMITTLVQDCIDMQEELQEIYSVVAQQNRGALALPTLYLHKAEYDEKHHTDYTPDEKQFKALSQTGE